MLRRRPYCLFCSPAVSGSLVRSTSTSSISYQNQQHHLHGADRTWPKDHLTHYRGVNSPAASQRMTNRLRTDGFKKIVQFVRSDSFLSSGQLPWSSSTLHSTVNSHHGSLYAVQYRQLSLSATAYNGTRYR